MNLTRKTRKFLFERKLDTVPIIMVSHSNDPVDIRECYRQQANAYMVKSPDFSSWVQYFSHLCHFWIDTIVLPKAA
jgi:DNA-binding NarL/FixJ family response regulator